VTGVNVDETAAWALAEVAVLTTVPEYGSPEWHGLEPSDPRRQASLVVAAERWREAQAGGVR